MEATGTVERAENACVDFHQRGAVRTVINRAPTASRVGLAHGAAALGQQCPCPAAPPPRMALWLPILDTPVGNCGCFLPRSTGALGSAVQLPQTPRFSSSFEMNSVGLWQVTSCHIGASGLRAGSPPTLCAERTGPGGLWGRLDPHSPFSPVTFRGPFCPRCRAERIADLISFLNGLIFLSKDI